MCERYRAWIEAGKQAHRAQRAEALRFQAEALASLDDPGDDAEEPDDPLHVQLCEFACDSEWWDVMLAVIEVALRHASAAQLQSWGRQVDELRGPREPLAAGLLELSAQRSNESTP